MQTMTFNVKCAMHIAYIHKDLRIESLCHGSVCSSNSALNTEQRSRIKRFARVNRYPLASARETDSSWAMNSF